MNNDHHLGAGALIGFDEFLKDFQEVANVNIAVSDETIIESLLEQTMEKQGGIIGVTLPEEMSKDNHLYHFDFISNINDDNNDLMILYLACRRIINKQNMS